jgi:hypothetical protein
MTTASLWGRRRVAAPAEPTEATRAADLTQAEPEAAGEPAPSEAPSRPEPASDAPARVEPAAAEQPDPPAEERP